MIIEFSDLQAFASGLLDDPVVITAGGLPWFTMASIVARNRFRMEHSLDKLYTDAEDVASSLASNGESCEHLVQGIYYLMQRMTERIKRLIPAEEGLDWIAGRSRAAPSSVVFLRVNEYGCIEPSSICS